MRELRIPLISAASLPRGEERMDPVQQLTAESNPGLESAGSASALVADGYDTK